MKLKEKLINIKNNLFYKTLISACFSLIFIIIFAIYNAFLGIKYADEFAIGIAIYYFLLVWIKSATLIVEKKIFNKNINYKNIIRLKNYKISSIFIFVIDLCLIAPIILMCIRPKNVNFGIIPAIAMAAYSTYKICIAIINYRRSKKSKNPTIVLLREINIIDALVSILSLQHTLIMVNGGMDKSMQTLSLATSIAIIVVIILFSVLSFIRNKKNV